MAGHHQNVQQAPQLPVRAPSPIRPPANPSYSTTVNSNALHPQQSSNPTLNSDHSPNVLHHQPQHHNLLQQQIPASPSPPTPSSDPNVDDHSPATTLIVNDPSSGNTIPPLHSDDTPNTDPELANAQNVNSTTYDPDGAGVEFVVLNDDVLTSVANATLVLLDGSDLERLAVLFQFPQFLEHCPDDTLTIMVPEICRDAVRWKEEVQMAAAEALYFVVNMHIPESVAKRIVIAALRIIQMSESGDVFDAWGEILSMMLPQVKREDVLSLVVPATVDRASSNTVESRRLAARIIGSLNDALTPKELEEQFLNQAIKLCDDNDASVRAMIAQSLASVGSKLPLRISERQLWPKLDHLMSDKNARVRAAAMRAVAKSAEAHKSEARTSTSFSSMLLPTFLRECSNASKVASSDLRTVDDDTYLMLEIFSEVYGYLLCAVHPLFESEETWNTALNALRRMVTCNGPTVRHWCAFNIPAVALVCGQQRPAKIKGVVNALSADTDVETRATLAAGIHETARVLANGELRNEILSAIANLMTDQNPQVRMNSLTHFAELLTLLASSSNVSLSSSKLNGLNNSSSKQLVQQHDSSDTNHTNNNNASTNNNNNNNANGTTPSPQELAPIFESLETMSQDSWRTQELLAKQIDECADKIPQEMLCEHVAPLLFQMARESTYLVRRASISALISVVRYIPDTRRRDHILRHFRSEWARGKVYWTRLAYIDGSTVALSVLSNKLFTQLFASELLTLAKDPVANVRLRLVRLMPRVAAACGTKPIFKHAMEALLGDEDEEIRNEAVMTHEVIGRMRGKTPEEEAENARKEAGERKFFTQRIRKAKTNNMGKNNNGNTNNNNNNNESNIQNQNENQQKQAEENGHANGVIGSNGSEVHTKSDLGSGGGVMTIHKNKSFTNNSTDTTIGAKPTIVTHSALGSNAAAALPVDSLAANGTSDMQQQQQQQQQLQQTAAATAAAATTAAAAAVTTNATAGMGTAGDSGGRTGAKRKGSRFGCCFS